MKDMDDVRQEWQDQGMTETQIREAESLMLNSPAANPAAKLARHIERIQKGEIKSINWPWGQLTKLSPSLKPGEVTVFAGSPGASKSFALVQCLWYWTNHGVKARLLALEGTLEEHTLRVLAQLSLNSWMTSFEWIEEHPKESSDIMGQFYTDIHKIGNLITTTDKLDGVSYDSVTDWLRVKARQGVRIIAVDPITSADGQNKPWIDDKKLVSAAKKIAGEYQCSIIIVSHPSKNNAMPSLDSLSGGAAFQRHSDCVLWLEAIEPKNVSIMGYCGRTEDEIDRVMHLLKVRNGRGQGKQIGYVFDKQCLLLDEKGIILKD